MSIRLKTLPTNSLLSDLQTAITQFEENEYELISLACGVVGGQASNTATFRRTPDHKPGPLTLKKVDGDLSLQEQENKVNEGESGGKKLVSYAGLFVEGQQTNVAAYHG